MTTTNPLRERLLPLLLVLLAVGSLATTAMVMPAAAATQDGGNATTNTTATIPDDTRDAKLDIQQPYHVDGEVQTRQTSRGTVYRVRGPRHWVEPTNFRTETVTDAGVRGDTGLLRYDAGREAYVFDPQGTSGTFTLYWESSEQVAPAEQVVVANTTTATMYLTQQDPETLTQRQVDSVYRWANRSNLQTATDAEAKQIVDWQNWEKFGTTPKWATNESLAPPTGRTERPTSGDVFVTRTAQSEVVVYEARVQVTGAAMVHVGQDEYEQTQDQAALWQEEIVEPLSDYVAVERIPQVIDRGVAWVQFTLDPTAAFRSSLLLILLSFASPGGLFWLAILSGLPTTLLIRETARRWKAEEAVGDVDDLERREAELDAEESKQLLAQEDYAEGPDLPEGLALPFRMNVGDDLYSGTYRLASALSPVGLKQIHLAPLLADDRHEWFAKLTRSDDEGLEAAETVRGDRRGPVADGGDVEYKPIADCDGDEFGAMELSDIDSGPIRRGVAFDSLPDVPGSNASTMEELVEGQLDELGVDLEHEFDDSMELWGEAVADVLTYISSTDYVTEEGGESPTRRSLNALYELFSTADERYQAQYFRKYKIAMLYASEHLDDADRAIERIDALKRDGSPSSDDVDDIVIDDETFDIETFGDGLGNSEPSANGHGGDD